MEKIKKIITHPGNAHRDDLYSVAIALAKFGFVSVSRREPTFDELEDPEVLVLDVGMRYEPEKMNFDHHQFPRDALESECALSLFLRHLDVENWFVLQPWYRTLVTADAKGPFVAARKLGLEKIPLELLNPIEGDLLEIFQSQSIFDWKGEVGPHEAVHNTYNDPFIVELRAIGSRLCANARKFYDAYKTASMLIDVIQLNGLNGFVQKDRVNPRAVAALREHEYGNEIAFSIAKSDRENEGWVLYRYDNHPRIDFNYLNRNEKLLYIHKNGFIAKTFPSVTLEETIELMKFAIP